MTLQDVSPGDLITSARQNEINDYIEDGLIRVKTLSLDTGSGDIKTTGNFTDGTNNVTASQMKSAYDGLIVPTVETKSGSDAGGSDGDSNRTLVLSNVPTTMFLLIYGGQCLVPTTDYSISGDTITFLNKVYNTVPIIVLYFT